MARTTDNVMMVHGCKDTIISNFPRLLVGPRQPFFTTAGVPAAMQSSGMSLVTTLPAAMMQRDPIVTPGQTVTLPQSQVSAVWAYEHMVAYADVALVEHRSFVDG